MDVHDAYQCTLLDWYTGGKFSGIKCRNCKRCIWQDNIHSNDCKVNDGSCRLKPPLYMCTKGVRRNVNNEFVEHISNRSRLYSLPTLQAFIASLFASFSTLPNIYSEIIKCIKHLCFGLTLSTKQDVCKTIQPNIKKCFQSFTTAQLIVV